MLCHCNFGAFVCLASAYLVCVSVCVVHVPVLVPLCVRRCLYLSVLTPHRSATRVPRAFWLAVRVHCLLRSSSVR